MLFQPILPAFPCYAAVQLWSAAEAFFSFPCSLRCAFFASLLDLLLPELYVHQKHLVLTVTNVPDVCALVVAPCGVGKSVSMYGLLNYERPDAAIVYVPGLELIRQFSRTWDEYRKVNYQHRVVVISSDPSVKKKSKNIVAVTLSPKAREAAGARGIQSILAVLE